MTVIFYVRLYRKEPPLPHVQDTIFASGLRTGCAAAWALQEAASLIWRLRAVPGVPALPKESVVPFFNFEVRTESHVMLTEGKELADRDAARVEAAQRIGQLLTDHAGRLWVDEVWQMDVTDQRGLILYVINVTAMKTAATG